MAQRLDLRQRNLQASGLRPARHTPDMDLLQGLFDPGMIYAGFRPNSGQNAPLMRGAVPSLMQGGIGGLGGFDSLFDAAGRVSDPSGLLKALNLGNVLAARPRTDESFSRNYPGSGNPSFTPGVGGMTMGYMNQPGGQARAYGQSGARPDLLNWLRGLGLDRGQGSVAYDPGNIRYGNYQVAPGVNLMNANRQQLENWAQQTYGVDLLTLAASPTELLEARQKYMGDPSGLFNPADPGMLALNAIPGLDPETSAARLAAYSSGVTRQQDEASRGRESRLGGQMTELLRTNPEAMRTAYGRQLGMTADYAGAASRAASGSAPQPYDYSLQMQSAMLPDMIQRAIQAALAGL